MIDNDKLKYEQEQINIYKQIKQKMQHEKKQSKIKAILATVLIPIFAFSIKGLYPALETLIKLENKAVSALLMSHTLLTVSIVLTTVGVTYEMVNYVRMSNELKDLDDYLEELTNDLEDKKQEIKLEQEQKIENKKEKTREDKIKELKEVQSLLINHLQEEVEKPKTLTKHNK